MTTPTPDPKVIEKVARAIASRLGVLPPDAFDAARAAYRELAPLMATQAKAEALREAAEHITDDYLKRALLARAASIEGKGS